MYNLSEEQEIARAVAAKVNREFADLGLIDGESFFEAQKAYNNTLASRALRFLKEIEERIDSLSNKEVADLIKSLIASGLSIENEEELEYYIALLEQIALKRISNALEQMKLDENALIPDTNGLMLLIDTLKILHLKKQPKNRKSKAFQKWQKKLKNLDKTKKILKKNNQKSKNQTKGRQKNSGSKKESNSNDDSAKDQLIGKMTAAGVPPYGPYWNDVLSGFEGATDKIDFVNSWVVDEARRDEEKENKKEENQKEHDEPQKEKSDQKPEKSDREKIDELRMGKQQQNEEKINQEFQNPGNIKAAKDAADKKLEKTDKEMTDKDIAALKTKMLSGR